MNANGVTGWLLIILASAGGCSGTVGLPADGDAGLPDGQAVDAATDGQPPADADEPDADPCTGHCSNSILDCGETDLDCGGDCTACPVQEFWPNLTGSFPTVAATVDKVVVAWSVNASPVQFRCNDGSGFTAAADIPQTQGGRAPRLEIDSQGRMHLVYFTGGGASAQVHYARFSNETTCPASSWSAHERIDEDNGIESDDSRYPNIAVDANDEPHVCWTDNDFFEIHYRHAAGGVWTGNPRVIAVDDSNVNSRYCDVSVSATAAHLVWCEGDSPDVPSYTNDTGSGFDSNWYTFDPAYHRWPQIVATSNGNLHVLFTRTGSGDVKYWRRYNSVWEAERIISSGPTDWTWTSLNLDNAGTLHGVWHQTMGNPAREQVHYCTGIASTGIWDTPRQVSTHASLHNFDATGAIDPQGRMHMAWVQIDDATPIYPGRIYYRVATWDDLGP
jgi:hypothetical protein